MYNPNDADDPRLDAEFKRGDIVHFAKMGDILPTTPLKILKIGNSTTSWDYIVISPTGNKFWLKLNELAEGQI